MLTYITSAIAAGLVYKLGELLWSWIPYLLTSKYVIDIDCSMVHNRICEYAISNRYGNTNLRLSKFVHPNTTDRIDGHRYDALDTLYFRAPCGSIMRIIMKETRSNMFVADYGIQLELQSMFWNHHRIVAFVKQMADKKNRKSMIYRWKPNQDGGYWNLQCETSKSGVQTTKITQVQSIVQKAVDSETRAGIMLYGPPGTGKSRMVSTIAKNINISIGIIDLSSPNLTDASINTAFSMLPENPTIILIEDIDYHVRDIINTNEKANAKKNSLTIAGILNAFDGIATSKDLVLIITTNSPDILEGALTRPGRIHHKIEVGYLTDSDLKTLGVSGTKIAKLRRANPAGITIAQAI